MSAVPPDANDSPESPQSDVSASAPADSDEPIRGGRRLGDDPFLADEGLFWWLPRTFSLLVVAVALMLLGAHLFGGDDEAPPPATAEADPQPEVAPPPSPLTVSAAAEAQRIVPAVAPRAVGPVAQRDRARSYNARRRALLQEADALLGTLTDGAGATPESDRDRRALRDFVERMDTPAR